MKLLHGLILSLLVTSSSSLPMELPRHQSIQRYKLYSRALTASCIALALPLGYALKKWYDVKKLDAKEQETPKAKKQKRNAIITSVVSGALMAVLGYCAYSTNKKSATALKQLLENLINNNVPQIRDNPACALTDIDRQMAIPHFNKIMREEIQSRDHALGRLGFAPESNPSDAEIQQAAQLFMNNGNAAERIVIQRAHDELLQSPDYLRKKACRILGLDAQQNPSHEDLVAAADSVAGDCGERSCLGKLARAGEVRPEMAKQINTFYNWACDHLGVQLGNSDSEKTINLLRIKALEALGFGQPRQETTDDALRDLQKKAYARVEESHRNGRGTSVFKNLWHAWTILCFSPAHKGPFFDCLREYNQARAR